MCLVHYIHHTKPLEHINFQKIFKCVVNYVRAWKLTVIALFIFLYNMVYFRDPVPGCIYAVTVLAKNPRSLKHGSPLTLAGSGLAGSQSEGLVA